jgi:hypothetical protein
MNIDNLIKKATQFVAILSIAIGVSMLPIGTSTSVGILISGGVAHATTGGAYCKSLILGLLSILAGILTLVYVRRKLY